MNTDDQFRTFLPLIMADTKSSKNETDDLMMILMIQAMGNQPLSMDSVLPLLLMKENSEDDSSKFLIKIIVSGVNI